MLVRIPSAECILGNKMTAFAPHTTGIPLHQNKDMEVMKQFYEFYDVCTLIDLLERSMVTMVQEQNRFVVLL